MDPNAAAFTAWHKTEKALRQEFRTQPRDGRIAHAIRIIPDILARCGYGSANRRSVLKIAKALTERPPVIYAPSCPDYGNNGHIYTFHGLGGGVSLLTRHHVGFLARLTAVLPEVKVIFLLADQEADDEEILRSVSVDRGAFLERMHSSLAETRKYIAPQGWTAEFMTHAIPDLRELEREEARRIAGDPAKRSRINDEMRMRASMYRRINPRMTEGMMRDRTIRTAAQYLAMGQFVKKQNALVCNHSTTNLKWYAETDVAILHNPISVY